MHVSSAATKDERLTAGRDGTVCERITLCLHLYLMNGSQNTVYSPVPLVAGFVGSIFRVRDQA